MSQTVRFKMLDAVTVTGDGPTFDLDYPSVAAALQMEFSDSPTRIAGTLQGLIDGATFDTIAEVDTDEGYLSGEVINLTLPMLVRKLKFNLGTLTGSSRVSVYFAGRS
jgi:hypothetical protein